MLWQDDTVLPGQFKGGGAGFGPGGFQGAPRLTANPAGPPPGLSLSNGGASGASVPPEVMPPTNSSIPSGKQVGAWTNPFTNAHINPTTGQLELLPQGGGGFPGVSSILRGIRRIPGAGTVSDLITPSDELAAPTGVELPRTLGRSPSGPLDPDIGQPGVTRGPVPVDLSQSGFQQPAHPSTMRYPSWPTPPAPAAAPASYPHMPWPDTGAAPGVGSQAPAVLPPRPRVVRAAGPAAVRQQPNLGAYGGSPFTTVDRPNANPGIGGGMLGGGMNSPRGQGGAPVATALDLSRLFGGGQPAPVAAAPVRAPVAAPVYRQPSIRMVPPAIPIGGGAGNVMEAPSPRRKSSSTSQGGGY